MAFLFAPVCLSQVDEGCPGTDLERGPKLLSSLEPLKNAAREEGYQGRLVFRVTVTETGSVVDPVIERPSQSTGSERITTEIFKLRFCPAVRSSRYAAVRATFDVQLK